MKRSVLTHFTAIRTSIAIMIAVLTVVVVVLLISSDPGVSLTAFFLGPFQSGRTIANIFETASPIMFAGLAIAVSFQARQFYIGAEGALYLAAAVGTGIAVSTTMPWFLHVPFILLCSACIGGIWGALPGWLKVRYDASEVVSALMLNFVAYFGGLFLVNSFFRDPEAGYMVSYTLPESAWLTQFIPRTRIHWGIVIGLVLALVVQYLFYHTTTGYEIRMTGYNRRFARFGGVRTSRVIVHVHILTGMIAGVGGMTEVMGIHRVFTWQTSPGFGWDGVVVAIIGRNRPLYVVLAALFLAYLRVGGRQLKLMSDVPSEIVTVIQAIIILLITAQAFLGRMRRYAVLSQNGTEEREART